MVPKRMENQVCGHRPDVRIDTCPEMTRVKESFSTTKGYPTRPNGLSSPTSPKWLQIALQLERLYPLSPKLFPPGTEDLITDFDNKFLRSVATALVPLLLSRIWAQLGDKSKDYFRTTRERMFRGSLETFSAPGTATAARWIAVRDALEPFARDADARGASDTFLFGEQVTYPDVVAVCWLGWARRMWGEDTQEWAELETWHGGRWGRLTHAFNKWEYVDTPSAPDSAKCVFQFPV